MLRARGDRKELRPLLRSPEQAKKLAAGFPGVKVVIEGNIGTSFIERSLPLNGMKSLAPEIVEALAEFKGSLNLNGLTTLDAATATALAALDTWNGDLSSIVAIESPDSVEIAAALATRKGPLLLPNLMKISPKTLTALIEKEDVVIPLIETLELIQEPDGSPTEDFVIPKGFQSRQKAPQQGRYNPAARGWRRWSPPGVPPTAVWGV